MKSQKGCKKYCFQAANFKALYTVDYRVPLYFRICNSKVIKTKISIAFLQSLDALSKPAFGLHCVHMSYWYTTLLVDWKIQWLHVVLDLPLLYTAKSKKVVLRKSKIQVTKYKIHEKVCHITHTSGFLTTSLWYTVRGGIFC